MKTLYFLFIGLLTISCSEDDTSTAEINRSLIGEWQQVARFDGGSPEPYQNVEDGNFIEFRTDGTIFYDRILCEEGFYEDNEDTNFITTTFECDDFTRTPSYEYRFENNGNLVLTPNPSSCIEGCYDEFERVD